MRTTIEIDDALLERAKQLALERNVSLTAILETALHQFVEQAQTRQQPAFKLRKCPMYGRGLQPGLDWHDWEKIRTLIYEGRGGLIAFDTHILLHAHWGDSPWHERADQSLTSQAESGMAWAIPWPCIHEFLAVSTHPRIHDPPTKLDHALEQVASWLEAPTLRVLGATPGYWAVLRRVLERSRVTGPRVHDAHIVALCLHHGVGEIWTADRDFGRFEGLKVVNPLVDA